MHMRARSVDLILSAETPCLNRISHSSQMNDGYNRGHLNTGRIQFMESVTFVSLISGVVELILSFGLGLLTAFFSFRAFAKLNQGIDEIKALHDNNTAVAILHGCMMIAAAIIIHESLAPAIAGLQMQLFSGFSIIGILKFLGLTAGYVVIVLIITTLTLSCSVKLFLMLTHDIDELAEIAKNNISVSIVLGAVLIIMSLFLSSGVESFLSALVPYPSPQAIEIQ
jgi:uncharacterized membrane protein YjfL (UPF0719 family)